MASHPTKSATRIAAVVLFLWGGGRVQAARAPQQESAEQKEITNFPLSSQKLNKYESVVKAYKKLTAANPGLKKQIDAESGANDHTRLPGPWP